jgi:MFS family permease
MVAQTIAQKGSTQLRAIVRALRYRNFRLFFIGQSVSLIGTWMQRIALGWLVYRLTGSPFLLGLIGFVGQIPTFILASFAGVLADHWNRQRILVLTQSLAMLQAFVLAFLVLTEMILIWHIVVLSIVLGVINAFDMPTRQSFVVKMIDDKKDLGNAIALNSSMVNSARLLGPSLAGILIAAVGEGICFLINGLSYMAVVASLLLMKIAATDHRQGRARVWQGLREGLKYASRFEPIWAILLMLALVGVVGMPHTVLMPVFARDILRGGPQALGFLSGGAGVGALVGALYLASRRSVLGLGRMIPRAAGLLGAGLIAFSFSRVLVLSFLLMLFVGLGQMIQMASSNTILQTIVDDDKRGRVMSFYTMAFMGLAPFGSLLGGSLASRIGAPWTVFVGGVACLVGAGLFARRLPVLRAKVRPIYVTMGIIPEVASGIQSATDLAMLKRYPT